ncbi:MAG: T9SS type A sorting domain-containing protein [Balneolia bacterium]|nr:T9SS type A sorting domain-containing protein [Balneolia bacterium]
MKTLLLLFPVLILIALPVQAQTQQEIEEALRFYPLEVGNHWVYRDIYIDGFLPPDTTYYSIEVVADTVLANGQAYKKLESVNNIFSAHYEFDFRTNEVNQRVVNYLERVDEATANIYQWKPLEDLPFNEVLIDSLLTPMNEITEAKRWPDTEGLQTFRNWDENMTLVLFGGEVSIRNFIIDGLWFYDYYLAKDFGLSYIWTGEISYRNTNLIYFRDHLGNEFGEPVAVNTPTEPELPQSAMLGRNYPNPFNPSTTIPFELNNAAHVRLEVYDMLGRRVALLIDQPLQAGSHTARFEADSLPSGMYITRMQTEGEVLTQKMLLVK